MRCFTILSALGLCLSRLNSIAGQDCSIPLVACSDQPLFLKPHPQSNREAIDAFLLPEKNQIISVKTNDTVQLECPGGKLKFDGVNIQVTSKSIRCSSKYKFEFDGNIVDIRKVFCTTKIKATAIETANTCYKTFKEAKLGFKLADNSFVNHITVCFDHYELNTLYTVYDLSSKIDQYIICDRTTFIDSGFYKISNRKLNDVYTQRKQQKYFNNLLGLSNTSNMYIKKTPSYYICRGHLTAKTDFIYSSQQLLTFDYVNTAPQWQTLNVGNWLNLEKSVRKFSTDMNLNLKVYTGTYDVTTLPHARTNMDVKLYLYVDVNNNAMPIPRLFWKVVYDPQSMNGVAFISVNNPFHSNNVPDNVICKDICNQINWINWNPMDQKSGYSYCCTVDDLRTHVKTLPSFPVLGLLNRHTATNIGVKRPQSPSAGGAVLKRPRMRAGGNIGK